jgi:hypothetical protein
MVDIYEASAVVAAVGVLIGVVYYVLDMRNQSKVRQTDLVMRLYATFSSTEFQDAWSKLRKKASDFEKFDDIFEFDEKRGLREINQVCLFFEGIGILLQRKLLDTRMIEDLFGGFVTRAWEAVKVGVTKARKQLNDPSVYYYFEYLYNEMKKKEQRR